MISSYDTEEILNSAHSMTGNDDFLKILERVKAQEDICRLAKTVTQSFPADYNYSVSMEKRVNNRVAATRNLLELAQKWI